MLQGLMMRMPLSISSLIEHADRYHGDTEVVSRRVEGDVHRYTYSDLHSRSRQLANALTAAGVAPGDRVATLAVNGYRHLELYFAVSGMGAVLHTINPRLRPEQIAWIVNHAEDILLFFDLPFLPIVEAIADKCPNVRSFVGLAGHTDMPSHPAVANLECYEDLLETRTNDYDWPEVDENGAAALCYTSGTTGDPKGVLYSHRSTVLHSYAIALPDALQLSARDAVLPVVPMFHVNAWGLPYACALVGAKLVLPGPFVDGKSLYELIEAEGVTFAAGVPTIWHGLLEHVEGNGLGFSTLERTVIGGSACPTSMLRRFEEGFGVRVLHAWGMTETSPLGSVAALKRKHADLPSDERYGIQRKQGRPPFGIDMKLVGEDGGDLEWDGSSFGELLVRGHWVAAGYYRDGGAGSVRTDAKGRHWMATGDVSTMDRDGYMHITDRRKDVIKSGGEWISSIEIEDVAASHPAVSMAACIAMPHAKWGERPLLVVATKPGADLTREELLDFYAGRVASWQVPDEVVFVESIPLGATGKVLKTRLRAQFLGQGNGVNSM